MKRSKFRLGQRVRFIPDGRTGVLVRRVKPYLQWQVRQDDGRVTWWWESEMAPA